MALGQFFQHAGVDCTHVPGFHQRRPQDYPPRAFDHVAPITFHNIFSNTKDPAVDIYEPFLLGNKTNSAAVDQEEL